MNISNACYMGGVERMVGIWSALSSHQSCKYGFEASKCLTWYLGTVSVVAVYFFPVCCSKRALRSGLGPKVESQK